MICVWSVLNSRWSRSLIKQHHIMFESVVRTVFEERPAGCFDARQGVDDSFHTPTNELHYTATVPIFIQK